LNSKSKPVGTKKWAQKAWGYAWHSGFWHRFLFAVLAIAVFWIGAMYGVAQWYIHRHRNQPLVLGATFLPDDAESFGLDPHDTLNAMLGDLKLKQVRLVSYWEDIEPTPGQYDFSNLDWQFAVANKYHAKVSLAIGLRQPRWPECHSPSWVNIDPKNESAWRPQLNKFIEAVVEHYQNNPALQNYELENESSVNALTLVELA
jgi:hypothetical protein